MILPWVFNILFLTKASYLEPLFGHNVSLRLHRQNNLRSFVWVLRFLRFTGMRRVATVSWTAQRSEGDELQGKRKKNTLKAEIKFKAIPQITAARRCKLLSSLSKPRTEKTNSSKGKRRISANELPSPERPCGRYPI